jgi:hypothetical protein
MKNTNMSDTIESGMNDGAIANNITAMNKPYQGLNPLKAIADIESTFSK